MAVSVTGTMTVSASITDARSAVTGAAGDAGSGAVGISGAWQIASGTASGQADKVWRDTRSVATGATDSLDLAGTLTNSYGETTTFVKIKAVFAVAAAGNTTTLQAARPASNGVALFGAASGSLAAVGAGGIIIAWADPVTGVTVTAGTGDLLSVINSAGATAAYDIIIVGTSA